MRSMKSREEPREGRDLGGRESGGEKEQIEGRPPPRPWPWWLVWKLAVERRRDGKERARESVKRGMEQLRVWRLGGQYFIRGRRTGR